MAIIETDLKTKAVTRSHEGCVVKIRKYVADRNHSDTLDYSDWRSTVITEALVSVATQVDERFGDFRRSPISVIQRVAVVTSGDILSCPVVAALSASIISFGL